MTPLLLILLIVQAALLFSLPSLLFEQPLLLLGPALLLGIATLIGLAFPIKAATVFFLLPSL